jgi:hypothetical protein
MGHCHIEMKLKLAYIKNAVTSMSTHPFRSIFEHSARFRQYIYSAISVWINLSADRAYHLETFRRTLKSLQKPNHYREIQPCLGFKPDSFFNSLQNPHFVYIRFVSGILLKSLVLSLCLIIRISRSSKTNILGD